MAIIQKKSKEEKIQAKEKERIHKEVVKLENEYRKQDKIPHEGAFVTLEHINKIYDNHVQAVYDFNLDIKPEEFIVFVGPSGCGKSTTLRMIAGLENITYGNLFINGIYANDLEPKDRDIAMVFQSYALYPHMTVFDNMAFGLKIRKVPTLVVDNKVLFEKNVALNKIEKEVEKLRDEINVLEFKIKKEPENSELFSQKNELLKAFESKKDLLNKAQEEAEIARTTPKLGTDYDKIRRLNNDLKFYKKAEKQLNSEISKLKAEIEKNPSSAAKNKAVINQDSEELITNSKNIERTLKDIDYLKNNLVPVYKNKHLNKKQVREQVNRAAKILDLTDYLDRKPSALSGGQCQRVALGRAIVRNSKLFLMDEPLSNLDAKLRVQMRSEIVKLHKSLKTTTIYVTHDQTEAMTMASRIVVMSKGYIQQIGTPKDIYNHPANIFVASFIGSPAMNIFDCEYDNGVVTLTDSYKLDLGDEYRKAHDEFIDKELATLKAKKEKILDEILAYETYQKELHDKKAKKNKENPILTNTDHYEFNKLEVSRMEKLITSYEQYKVTKKHNIKFGIRPEDIVRTEDRTPKQNLSSTFKAEVIVPELLGHEYYVHFTLGDRELISKIQGNENIQAGDIIEFGFNLEFLHLFDDLSTKLIK